MCVVNDVGETYISSSTICPRPEIREFFFDIWAPRQFDDVFAKFGGSGDVIRIRELFEICFLAAPALVSQSSTACCCTGSDGR